MSDTVVRFKGHSVFGLFSFDSLIPSKAISGINRWLLDKNVVLQQYYCFYFIISMFFYDGFRTMAISDNAKGSNDAVARRKTVNIHNRS